MGIVSALFTGKQKFIVFLIGLTTSDLLNLFLKTIIRYPRPSGKCLVDGVETGCNIVPEYGKISQSYGMPSGHAQCLGYTAMFWSIITIKERKQHATSLCGFLAVIALTVAWSRVKVQCHSLSQVLVGLIIGGAIGGAAATKVPMLP